MENVNQVEETGFDTYLQNQFASTVTPYPDPRPNDSINDVQQTFFLNSIAGGDQLRHAHGAGTERILGGERANREQPAGVHELPARRSARMRWEITRI